MYGIRQHIDWYLIEKEKKRKRLRWGGGGRKNGADLASSVNVVSTCDINASA